MGILGEIGPEAETMIPALTTMLNDKDENVRQAAALAIRRVDPQTFGIVGPAAVRALTELLKDGDCQIRQAAAEALGEIGPEAEGCHPGAHEAGQRTRAGLMTKPCARGIGEDWSGGRPGRRPDCSWRQGLECAGRKPGQGPGEIGPEAKTAIPALTELLEDKDEQVRKAAAESLRRIKLESRRFQAFPRKIMVHPQIRGTSSSSVCGYLP